MAAWAVATDHQLSTAHTAVGQILQIFVTRYNIPRLVQILENDLNGVLLIRSPGGPDGHLCRSMSGRITGFPDNIRRHLCNNRPPGQTRSASPPRDVRAGIISLVEPLPDWSR